MVGDQELTSVETVWTGWTVRYLYCCLCLRGGKARIPCVPGPVAGTVSPITHSHMDLRRVLCLQRGLGSFVLIRGQGSVCLELGPQAGPGSICLGKSSYACPSPLPTHLPIPPFIHSPLHLSVHPPFLA